MATEQNNSLRNEQISLWFNSETNKASNAMKEAEKIKFPIEVQFLCACNSNDWPEIKRLLSEGININCTQDDGLTALHQACIDADQNLLKFLVENDANIDVQDKEGWTPLFAAVSCNYLDIIKYLISCGARLDIVSFEGELPIDQTSNLETIAYLKSEMGNRGLDPDSIKNLERNMMLQDIENMLRTKNYENFFLVENGASMLHVAASKDYLDVLEQLIQLLQSSNNNGGSGGGNIMLNKCDDDGWNALHVAAHWGHRRACILLLEAEIDFERCTNTNQTVLEVTDDDLKPYLREEIRKARFRRQDRVSVKRPAQTQNGEFQPDQKKIICQEKGPSTPPSPLPATSSEAPAHVNGADSGSTAKSKTAHEEPADKTASGGSSSTVSMVADETPGSLPPAGDSRPTEELVEEKDDSEKEPTKHSSKLPAEVLKASLEDQKNDEKPKMSAVLAPTKCNETEMQRKKEATHRRRVKKPTQPVDADEVRRLLSDMGQSSTAAAENNHMQQQSDPDSDATSSNTAISTSSDETSAVPQVSENPEVVTSVTEESKPYTPTPEFPTDLDKRRRSGGQLVNKKRVRDRLPTATVDPKDIQAARREMDRSDASEAAVSTVDGSTDNHKMLNSSSTHKSQSGEPDYKALYEAECREKEKLARNLSRIKRDLQLSQEQIKSLQGGSTSSPSGGSNSQNPKIEIERLLEENKKIKEANSALIRVISRLSHSSAGSKSGTVTAATTAAVNSSS